VGGFANDMYNNDGGKGGAYVYEAMKQNKGWRTLGRLFASSISYRHRYYTYLYYSGRHRAPQGGG